MQQQRLTPGVQRRNDAGLGPEILRVGQQGAQGIPCGLEEQGAHHWHVRQPERIEVMGQREDHMIMVTGQEPGLLEGEPALGLEIRALRT